MNRFPVCFQHDSMLCGITCLTLGLDTVCAKTSVVELSETPLPCILQWNQNDFVVL